MGRRGGRSRGAILHGRPRANRLGDRKRHSGDTRRCCRTLAQRGSRPVTRDLRCGPPKHGKIHRRGLGERVRQVPDCPPGRVGDPVATAGEHAQGNAGPAGSGDGPPGRTGGRRGLCRPFPTQGLLRKDVVPVHGSPCARGGRQWRPRPGPGPRKFTLRTRGPSATRGERRGRGCCGRPSRPATSRCSRRRRGECGVWGGP